MECTMIRSEEETGFANSSCEPSGLGKEFWSDFTPAQESDLHRIENPIQRHLDWSFASSIAQSATESSATRAGYGQYLLARRNSRMHRQPIYSSRKHDPWSRMGSAGPDRSNSGFREAGGTRTPPGSRREP